MRFSENVVNSLGGALQATDFTFNTGALPAPLNTLTTLAVTPVTSSGAGISEAVLTLSRPLALEDFLLPTILNVVATAKDLAGNAINIPVGHRISDIGLGLLGNGVYEPVWAKDQTIGASAPGVGYINLFDGTAWLGDKQNVTIEGHILTKTLPLVTPPVPVAELNDDWCTTSTCRHR